ncbi:MAG TPA: hypothetical protein VKY44_08545 [Flavobacterium sp.]|nr:hypothetical protein [Flavobacterium sp.]
MAQQSSSEEVDLGYLFKKSNDFLKGIVRGLFLILDFFKKYFIIIIVLILIGFAFGYFKDKGSVELYNNEILIIPNFESVDYLYDKAETINSKIASNDTVYLQNIFGDKYRSVKRISLEPIIDIYNFVSKSRQNIDVLKIISQSQDFSEYVEDMSTSKYFKYHRLNLSIVGKEHSMFIVESFLNYLNQNKHFVDYKNTLKTTKDFQVKEYYFMLTQIDSIIKANTRNNINSSVSVNTIADQSELIEKKRQLLAELQNLEMDQIDYSSIIKMVNAEYNIHPETFLDISNKIKYPLILVFLFSLAFFIFYIYKSLKKYADVD